MENFRNKWFTRFKLHAVWVVWWTVTPVCSLPAGMWIILCPVCPCCLPTRPLATQQPADDGGGVTVLVFKWLLFYLIWHKSSDAGNSDMPKRSCKVLPLNEKVKFLTGYWVISHHHEKKGEHSTMRCFQKENYIQLTFITVYQYNYYN